VGAKGALSGARILSAGHGCLLDDAGHALSQAPHWKFGDASSSHCRISPREWRRDCCIVKPKELWDRRLAAAKRVESPVDAASFVWSK
jgi:hypothetical protein